mmetsp:Transcript_57509/g.123608  ORF Transcript_57509/g.123608 Transcript_57509/m.123608 type:complete len:221 (-) Transcript_57509:149-811(-)
MRPSQWNPSTLGLNHLSSSIIRRAQALLDVGQRQHPMLAKRRGGGQELCELQLIVCVPCFVQSPQDGQGCQLAGLLLPPRYRRDHQPALRHVQRQVLLAQEVLVGPPFLRVLHFEILVLATLILLLGERVPGGRHGHPLQRRRCVQAGAPHLGVRDDDNSSAVGRIRLCVLDLLLNPIVVLLQIFGQLHFLMGHNVATRFLNVLRQHLKPRCPQVDHHVW